MAASSISALCGLRHSLLLTAVVVCALYCLPRTATALPMKGGLAQAVGAAKMDHQQQQQQQQQQQLRQKRAAIKTNCAQPDNLEAMFQQINSELNGTLFLSTLYNNNGKALSHPASAHPEEEISSENKTCPSSLAEQGSGSVVDRSLCPFYFNLLRLPEGYYPSSLYTAHCKCQRCVQHTALGCEPVTARVAVLRPAGCFQGLQKYQETHVTVNTACTCASGGQEYTSTTAAPTTWGVN